jgi:hypothetical protein
MSIKEKYHVDRITYNDCKEWILKKHYAKENCNTVYVFGLFDNNKILQGVCTFGTPSSASLNVKNAFICHIKYCRVLELNRLVINNKMPKNSLSFFVNQCLNNINEKCLIVSYADINHGHHGYIYQATNWLYTGRAGDNIIVHDKNGNRIHTKTLSDKGIRSKSNMLKHGYTIKKIEKKFRYFNFTGNKREKKEMRKALKYEIQHYPKGENKNYDASYKPTIQGRLF